MVVAADDCERSSILIRLLHGGGLVDVKACCLVFEGHLFEGAEVSPEASRRDSMLAEHAVRPIRGKAIAAGRELAHCGNRCKTLKMLGRNQWIEQSMSTLVV